jgi:ISXO2-like transposase domain
MLEEPIIVEVDESKFGKRNYNRGHHVQGVWVFGGVERWTPARRIFVCSVENRNSETLNNLIRRHIRLGSLIYTDCWRAYNSVVLRDLGYDHGTVNHELYYVDPVTGVCTNTIEGTWWAIKATTSSRRRNDKFLQEDLIVFTWKRKHEER